MGIETRDEHYMDGKDKWTVHFTKDDDTRVNPGDYKEILQIIKNGEVVGTTTWHKNKEGKDKHAPYVVGMEQVPTSAKKVVKK